ncbi:hypothetical protein [Capnocytophaga canis]|uniref:hypothetical protein n=1 Tax=Capnocytophaga canis TaxID=1848903 RepID=UPI0037DD5D42
MEHFLSGIMYFPKGMSNILNGTRHFPKGMNNILNGTRHFPKGIECSPKGIECFPKGMNNIPKEMDNIPNSTRHFLVEAKDISPVYCVGRYDIKYFPVGAKHLLSLHCA